MINNGWQPIETAPKDGTWFDVWLPSIKPQTKFHSKGGCRSTDWHFDFDEKLNKVNNRITDQLYDGLPTHWMPLPKPPITDD